VRNWLDKFPERWIGCGCPIARPPRSLDLTPTFLFVGMHEGNVYATEVRDRDDIINRIESAAEDVVPRQVVPVRASIRRRCEVCVQAEGGHFEHLLRLRRVHLLR
jgi:hypothetical protein